MLNKKEMTKYTNSILSISILTLAIFTGCSSSGNSGDREREASKKPNIIYVLADQWRAQAIGYANDPNVKTPNLDSLATKSINFSNAVSVSPVCTPYRAALLTGRFPTSTGMFLNDLYLPEKELTMGEIYKQAGYNTAYIGKWHLDGHGRLSYIPQERRQGFDYWKANECTHNYNHSKYFAGNDTTARYWEGYDAFAQTSDAQQYINNHANDDNPFILILAYGVPHFPHGTAPERYKKMYNPDSIILRPNVPEGMVNKAKLEAEGYYAHCTALDSCIGALSSTINKAGINDNTIFIFTSDHGEMLGSQDIPPKTKQRPWDESVKVPFLLHYPKMPDNEGKVIDVPLNTPDILPTLLGLSGIDKPATIEGDDLSELITGEKTVEDMGEKVALIMSVAPIADDYSRDEYRGIRTSRYTYVHNLEGPWLLYDNQKDPYQMNNLIDDPEYKSLSNQLKKNLEDKLNSIGDDFQPREYYIEKWDYNVNANNGTIPYGSGPHKAQSPSPIM